MATRTKPGKYKSGFCNDINKTPQCEGTKPVSPSGEPMPVCLDWERCSCDCHELVSSMYEMIGMTREPAEQSAEYLLKVHAVEASNRQVLDEVYAMAARSRALSSPVGPDVHPDDERASNGTSSAADGPSAPPTPDRLPRPVFSATPTGRRARGQLEYDVLQICTEFVQGVWDWQWCTPKLVAERIGVMNAVEPPSTGAINAVWDRWTKIGFAEQAKKPSRFTKFTGGHTVVELDRAKGALKRAKKMREAEQRRGIPRPKAR